MHRAKHEVANEVGRLLLLDMLTIQLLVLGAQAEINEVKVILIFCSGKAIQNILRLNIAVYKA
jgi:hypothetical protein